MSEIDWQEWEPVDHGTLLFVIRGGQVLLIHKKRGLGAGKINGPGGRLNEDESPRLCAIREVQEELGVTPLQVTHCGELSFQFLDGYSIHVWVYRAAGCDGSPRETDEAIPLWTPLDKIPYDYRGEYERIWLPRLLNDEPFVGRFLFDRESMLDHSMEVDAGLENTHEDRA